MDRHGVKFLEIHYPTDAINDLHRAVFEKLTESMILFGGLCKNSNGNFIIKKLVEFATLDEQKVLLQRMVECGLADMCKDEFACRVVQIAVQKFDRSVVTDLIKALHSSDLVDICTDQTSIHATHCKASSCRHLDVLRGIPVLWRQSDGCMQRQVRMSASLLFHQYGNYVVQQMITICTSALMGKEERRLSPSDLGMYAAWYEQLL